MFEISDIEIVNVSQWNLTAHNNRRLEIFIL